MAVENRYYVICNSASRYRVAAWKLGRHGGSGKTRDSAGRLSFSIEKRGDDGRLYLIFETEGVSAAEFIRAAGSYGLSEEARSLAEWLSPDEKGMAESSKAADSYSLAGGARALVRYFRGWIR